MSIFKHSLLHLLFLVAVCSGCRSLPLLPPVNLAEPGWKLREGQAVWKANKSAPELAGELQVATHAEGRTLVQFVKVPIPFVVAETATNRWTIQFVPENRTFSGRGRAPSQLIWLYLPQCLAGAPPPKRWTMTREGDNWRFENKATGEVLEGWLAP